MKIALRTKDRVTSKLNVVLDRMTNDIAHAFIVPKLDRLRTKGAVRTHFEIKSSMGLNELRMTYMGHRSISANNHESDLSFVVYKLKKSEKYPGRSHLYRGEFPRVPESFKEDPPMKVLATFIKDIRFEVWNGADWVKDGWDTTRRDTADKLPHLVRVSIEAWSDEPVEGEPAEDGLPTELYSTVVFLPHALEFDEAKERTSSFRLSGGI